VLRNVDPIDEFEARRLVDQERQLDGRDAEEHNVTESSCINNVLEKVFQRAVLIA